MLASIEMKKITFIIIISILLNGCRTNQVLNTEQIEINELELWMINNSKEIKDITRLTSFKISNPKDYNREKLIQNIADSLKTPAIQKINIDNDRYEDLIVYGKAIPYLIINGRQPKILSLQRANNKVLAHSNSPEIIKVYEIEYGIGTKSVRQYDLILWNGILIEPTEKPNFKIEKIRYQAPGYENRLYNIDMKGEILFFDYSRNNNKSEIVWLKKGKVSKAQLKKLNDFFSVVNIKEVIPKNIEELHTINAKIGFETTAGNVEITDVGKKGTFSLIALYKIFDEIIDRTDFENVKKFHLNELSRDDFEEIKEIFEKEN